MYSWEIRDLLKQRNYRLGGDELLKVIDPNANPQLTHIKYTAYGDSYQIRDNAGEEFNFQAMPYEEAKAKGLVKRKK